jgi:polyisoprenoid-binding protein YceI
MKHNAAAALILAGLLANRAIHAACWIPVPAAGKISFQVSQAGAPLQGTFSKYDGQICLDPDNVAASRIQVHVATASVDTQLPELDEALRGDDFFAVSRWPQATFVSDSVRSLGQNRYEVKGKLTLRDVTRSIDVPFTFDQVAGGNARLTGKLSIQRLDYHIGLGQWADTRWVGNSVDVSFSVTLKPAVP